MMISPLFLYQSFTLEMRVVFIHLITSKLNQEQMTNKNIPQWEKYAHKGVLSPFHIENEVYACPYHFANGEYRMKDKTIKIAA